MSSRPERSLRPLVDAWLRLTMAMRSSKRKSVQGMDLMPEKEAAMPDDAADASSGKSSTSMQSMNLRCALMSSAGNDSMLRLKLHRIAALRVFSSASQLAMRLTSEVACSSRFRRGSF